MFEPDFSHRAWHCFAAFSPISPLADNLNFSHLPGLAVAPFEKSCSVLGLIPRPVCWWQVSFGSVSVACLAALPVLRTVNCFSWRTFSSLKAKSEGKRTAVFMDARMVIAQWFWVLFLCQLCRKLIACAYLCNGMAVSSSPTFCPVFLGPLYLLTVALLWHSKNVSENFLGQKLVAVRAAGEN